MPNKGYNYYSSNEQYVINLVGISGGKAAQDYKAVRYAHCLLR